MTTQTFPDDRGEWFEMAFTWLGWALIVTASMAAAAADPGALHLTLWTGAAMLGAVYVFRGDDALPRIGGYGKTTAKIIAVVVPVTIALRAVNAV